MPKRFPLAIRLFNRSLNEILLLLGSKFAEPGTYVTLAAQLTSELPASQGSAVGGTVAAGWDSAVLQRFLRSPTGPSAVSVVLLAYILNFLFWG